MPSRFCLRQKHWTAVGISANASVSESVMVHTPTRKKTSLAETVPSSPGRTVLKAEARAVSTRYEPNSHLLPLCHGNIPAAKHTAPPVQTRNKNIRARVGSPVILLKIRKTLRPGHRNVGSFSRISPTVWKMTQVTSTKLQGAMVLVRRVQPLKSRGSL